MKKLLCLALLLSCLKNFSQNVKIEITDYSKSFEEKTYSTCQYVNSSYSHSRPTIILVANKDSFMKIQEKIPQLYSAKQEYTDVYLLGIQNFDASNITEVDRKILDLFFDKIIKYRNDNELPIFDKDHIKSLTQFISKQEDLCKYFSCKSILKKRGE